MSGKAASRSATMARDDGPLTDSAPKSAATARRRTARRRANTSVWVRWAEPMLVLGLVLVAWELFSRSGVIASEDLPGVDEIARAFREDLSNPDLWSSIATSLRLWVIGIAIVVVVTIPLGLLLGLVWPLYEATRLLVEFLRTIPSVAALPILVFVYGISPELTVTLVVLTAAWPLLIQAMTGAHDVDPITVETGRIYGLSRVQIFFHVILPSAMPYIMTGIKLAANIGLIIAIAASLIVGGEGLGALIGSASDAGNTALLYARILVTGLLGLAVSLLVTRAERRLLRWHSSQRVVR